MELLPPSNRIADEQQRAGLWDLRSGLQSDARLHSNKREMDSAVHIQPERNNKSVCVKKTKWLRECCALPAGEC